MDKVPIERRKAPRGRMRAVGDVLYGTMRWMAGHMRGFWTALIAFLSLAFILCLAMVVAFAMLAEEVMEGDTTRFDQAVLRWIGRRHAEGWDHVMLEFTALGNFAVLLVLGLSVSAFLWLSNHKYSVALLVLGAAGGSLANNILKLSFDRQRPDIFEPVSEVMTSSFPSGHAMMATIVYGSVAYLVGRLEPTRAMRSLTWTLAVLIILLVGISRMYLGVHYPTDILGGYLAGIAWIGLVVAGMHAVRFFAEQDPVVEQKVEEQEHDLHAEEERAAGVRE